MNRLFIFFAVFILGLLVQTNCLAQTVQIDSVSVKQDETVVVDVNTDDFTAMQFISMTIEWDPNIISYGGVLGANDRDFPNLGQDDFDESEVANGKLMLTWADDVGTDPISVDFLEFFKIDFVPIGAVGTSSPVRIIREGLSIQRKVGDDLTEVVGERKGDASWDLFEAGNVFILPPANPGNTGATPAIADTVKFNFNTPAELLCIGDQMCYSLGVENFDSILTFTAPVTWNVDVLKFNRTANYNLQGLTESSVRLIGEGAFLITHDITIGGDGEALITGVTVPDGTAIVDICFDVVGVNNFEPLIVIGNTPLISNQEEVVDKDAEFLELKSGVTTFESVNCDQLIILNTECAKGIPGETVCININANNFANVGNMLLTLEWDADVMEFVDLQNINPELDGIEPLDTQADNVILNWTKLGTDDVSLADNSTLFAACFRLKDTTVEGQNTTVKINRNDLFIGPLVGDPYDDIRISDDCFVEVEAAPLPEIVLTASSEEVNEGGNVCVDISAENFEGITSFEFPIVWNPLVLTYTGVKDEAFAGMILDDSDITDGRLRVRWADASPATVQNMASLFAICFEAIGDAGTPTGSTAIAFPNTTAEPVLFAIGTTELERMSMPGLVTLINVAPTAVTFSNMAVTNVKKETAVCVPITVNGFTDVLSLQYSVEWDSTVLRFDSLQDGLLQDLTFGEVNNGLLNFSWIDEDVEGISLADGGVLAELCFTTIGAFGDRTTLDFTQGERGIEIKNANEEDLELINSGKEISITPFGIVDVQMESPSCAQSNGSIRVEMTGGTSRYIGTWEVRGNSVEANAMLNNPFITLENVAADFGEVCLRVLDLENSSLNDRQCFTIEINDDRVPIAKAGPDLPAGCVSPDSVKVLLVGDFDENSSGATSGGSIDYEWTVLDGSGGVLDPFEFTNTTACATTPGTYILKITNGDGCVDTDTMNVVPSELPQINVENPDLLTCRNSEVLLKGEGEETGSEYEYEWRNETGEVLSAEAPYEIMVGEGGLYTFTVLNTENNCQNKQDVLVQVDKETPIANAGGNKVKGCDDLTLSLDGSLSSVGATIEYDWLPGPDAKDGVINPNSLTPQVTATGSFILTVENRLNGCTAVDTMEVIADRELPVARVVDEAFIGCSNSPATLDGTDSSPGSQFSYNWVINGLSVSDRKTATVRDTGEYLLIVINEENDNCVADTARVRVAVDLTPPTVAIPEAITIGCDTDCIDAAISTTNQGPDFTYQWLTEEGVICGGANELTAQIGSIGLYKFIITNTANSCADTSNVVVLADSENNAFSDAGATKELTCAEDFVTLNGTGSSQGVDIIYEWRFEEDPMLLSAEMTARVTVAGTYQLSVLDTVSGCQNVSSVLVTANTDKPAANAGEDFQIAGCQLPPNLRLNGSNSDSGEDIVYAWSGGKIEGDTSIISPNITAPGVYTLTVLNTATGCSDSDEIVVSSEMFTPVAIAGDDQTIDCTNNTVSIDATSSVVNEEVEIEWTTEDGHILFGETTLTPAFDSAGTYLLTLTTVDGCTDTDELTIDLNANVPSIDAGADLRIVCNEQMTIDASMSSSGPNLSATWTTADGVIVSGANDLLLEISAGGTYVLTIIDSTSNCRAIDEVFVDSDGDLPNAQAGANQEVCGKDATLSAATVREGVTGRWTTAESGAISENNSPETGVSNLANGNNLFIWTLSTEECPGFSIDSVMVNVATLPSASEDVFELTAGQELATLDLIENDRTTTTSFDINLLSQPTTGNLSEITEGVFEFSLPDRFLGSQEFEYEICSQTCADICDNALVRINVRPVLDSINVNPNAITPNGDGLNDVLTFDALYFDDYSDSELVVFNRWGDIIYSVSPYNNDWGGKTEDGTDLPAGTYYYVLRLDISEGEIIRGDVTILK